MTWSVAEARSQLSRVITAAAEEPQVLENRGRPVAVVVSIGAFADFERWRKTQRARSMADALAEIREICDEDQVSLDLPRRGARANAFVEALDGVDR